MFRSSVHALLRVRVRAVHTLVVCVLCGGLAACSGQFGESVNITPDRVHRVESAARLAVSLPDDEPFAVAEAQRFAADQAEATSSAQPIGQAECAASVTGVGHGWSGFQLGHVITNDTGTDLPVTVRFDVDYDYALERAGALNRSPETFALKVYISDAHKHVLHRYFLLGPDGRDSPDRSRGADSQAFDINLEAGQSYDLVLTGRVEVKGGQDSTPLSARIKVTGCSITVTSR